MSSRAKKLHDKIYNSDHMRVASVIVDLYRILEKQPLYKRIGFAFRVIFKRLPK